MSQSFFLSLTIYQFGDMYEVQTACEGREAFGSDKAYPAAPCEL